MLVADAKALLSIYCAATDEPILSSDDLDKILTSNARFDVYNRGPDDVNWDGAWNMNAAAADGWRIKAARVAAKFDFTSDVHGYTRSQMLRNFLQMAEEYASMDLNTISTGRGMLYDPVIGNLNGGV